MKPKSVKKLE